MDNVPQDFKPGKDYVSVVSADNFGNGVVSAHLMAEQLDGEGKIGVIFHEADFFVTKQRYEAFKQTIAKEYPDIEIVAEQGIAGPDFAGDAEKVATAMLSRNADLDGIWAVWDVPAEGVLAAARASGRADLAIATIDLGQNVAIDMAKDGPIVGLGAQRPYRPGRHRGQARRLGGAGREDAAVRRAERAARAARQRPRGLEDGLPRGPARRSLSTYDLVGAQHEATGTAPPTASAVFRLDQQFELLRLPGLRGRRAWRP